MASAKTSVPARLLPILLALPLALAPARAEVQQRCEGTLLEARGSAEQEQVIDRLRLSLSLEAEQRTSARALALLQERLASVRTALESLGVKEFQATSPSTWGRPAEAGKPPSYQASLQVSGVVAPSSLQALIRQVGSLPGVRMAPVSAEALPVRSSKARRALLAAAYRQSRERASQVAAVLGLSRLHPLEVQVEDDRSPVPLRAMGAKAEAAPPFDPAELPPPKDSASMLVRFCAR
jgi:uncharacterized protein YggE